jgi:Protein of unknown function, DUF481
MKHMLRKELQIVALFLLARPLMFADQISFKNGDRLTGDIVNSDLQRLNLQTSSAGMVSIQWSDIEGVSSTQKLYVRSKSGQVLIGTVSSSDDKLRIATADSGTVSVALADVVSVRSESEETKSQSEEIARLKKTIDKLEIEIHEKNPSLIDNWSGAIDTGFALAGGNASTKTFSLASAGVRSTARDLVYLTGTSLWSESRGPGVTASFLRGSILFDVNIKERPFAFVQLDLEHDEFADIVFRAVSDIGMGYHTIRDSNGKVTLDLMTGVGIDQIFLNKPAAEYGGDAAGLGQVVVGDKLGLKITSNTKLTQDLRFYPYFTSPGGYRIAFDTAIHTKLSKWLNFYVAAGDRYWSNPPPGYQTNDFVVLTGLGINFGRQQ